MRQLSKIIFINSAGIRYGEVRLDGNVHLIGTQGVGKSTVLRAILFFYTGDKNRLGISREKKSFDDFYLPGANSYLIYEVESEFGAFTLLVFRRNAHSVFRFIGAPFQREWLINEQGEVTADASLLRQRLGGVTMTRIVDEYQEYRDILYGNKRVAGKEFSRFCIMETSRYQNIPRSLQNVFLGAKVDADFIKEILIRSLGDEEPGIDLVYFRGQLAEFEREYNDIQLWYRKNPQGEVSVRRQADKLIALYRRLRCLDDELAGSLLELRFARRDAVERIPLLERQAEERETEMAGHKGKLDELELKCKQELSGLDEDIGIVKHALEKIQKLVKKYEALHIGQLLEEDAQEAALKARLTGEEQLRSRLTREYADISAKFADRETVLTLAFEGWKAAREKSQIEAGESYNAQIAKLIADTQEEMARIASDFREREDGVQEHLADLRERMGVCDKQLALAAHLSPFQGEIESTKAELARLKNEDGRLEIQERSLSARIEATRREGALLQERLTDEWKIKMEQADAELQEKHRQHKEIQALLDAQEGSLLQWLSRSKPDWTGDIGKVVDEQVLYAGGLAPRKGEGKSFFGVTVSLDALPCKVRTPVQLYDEMMRLESEEKDLKVKLENMQSEKETALLALNKKLNASLKSLRDEQTHTQTIRAMLPAKLESAKRQRALYEQQTLEARAREQEKYRQGIQALTTERVLAEEGLRQLQDEKAGLLQKARENEARRQKALLQQRDASVRSVQEEIKQRAAQLRDELQVLARERDAELSGQGADTRALARCETAIRSLSAQLEDIARNKETVFRYRSDKEAYLDRKEEFQLQKKALESKKEGLQERYRQRQRKEEDALKAASEALQSLREQLRSLREGLADADRFEQSNALPLLPEGREQRTDKNCRQLIDAIHCLFSDKRSTENDFYESVNAFTAHFSAGNVFGFKTDCHGDEQCRAFAESLAEFIDNEKIEEFRHRTSGHYTDLLLRISHEMDEVSRNSAEIAGIIKDINFDFRDKNFIGAVKSIELRSVASADKMVTLLGRIQAFNDEHGFQMGQVNLFSTDARDIVNSAATVYLLDLTKLLVGEDAGRTRLTLGDTFQLQFRIQENDNDTGWVEKISSVGSDGTDVLVKAMVNIMLINVFKERVSGRFTDFRIHCVMDEIGKLHPSNIKGILDFAGARNIYLVNGSPVPYNVADYKHTYLLTKDSGHTVIQTLLSRKEAESTAPSS